MIHRLLNDERGATAIEYGLIAALISVFLVAAFIQMGLSLEGIFDTIRNAMAGTG